MLPLESDVIKFAEEDIYLILFDVFYNSGFEMIQNYSQTISSQKVSSCAISFHFDVVFLHLGHGREHHSRVVALPTCQSNSSVQHSVKKRQK